MDALFELKDICFQYEENSKPILNNLNLTLYPGEVFLLSGASGEGKSTLMNIMNGIIPYRIEGILSGEILWESEGINDKKPVERASYIGTVMQNAQEQIIYPQVEDELAFPLENQGIEPVEIKRRLDKVLQEIKLEGGQYTKALSGGEKQRLITGATLGMKQKILILDEPLANLDEEKALLLMERLQELAKNEQKTIMIIEHRLEWALPYVDKIGWMKDRHLVVYESREDFEFNHKLEPCQKYLCSEEANKTLIHLKDISLTRGKKTLFTHLNWEIKEGSHWIIEGTNGCGKTSLLEVMMGLLKPTQGEVSYHFPKKKRFAYIGMVLQNPNYQLFMPSVYEEVLFGCQNKALGETLLKELGLWAYKERHPQSLSEGQKRRLGVALVLAREPEIIFFDEPTVGQDMWHLDKMMNLLTKLYQGKQMTTVTITHDRRYVHCMGDQVLKLDSLK